MSLLIDDRTVASQPGRVRANPFRYARYFPFWPLTLTVALLAGLVLVATYSIHALWLVIPSALLLWVHTNHIRAHFGGGCANPAIVLSIHPLLIAVYTDLSSGAGSYPVIKVLRHPSLSSDTLKPGARCATVALYQGVENARRWENFNPKLVIAADGNPETMRRLVEAIPPEDWEMLERRIHTLPKPWKPGLYPLL